MMDKTEILVVGGGIAGISAAVGAARYDRQVTLVEKDSYLGGLATGGCVLFWQGFGPRGSDVWGGLSLEIIEHLRKLNGVRFTESNGYYHAIVDPELLKYVCQELVLDNGVKLIQNMMAVQVEKKVGDLIDTVIFESKSGPKNIRAKIIIDATGDGNVIAWSGDSFNLSSLPISFSWNFGGIDIESLGEGFLTFQQKFQEFALDLGRVDDLVLTPMKDTLWCNGTYFEDLDPFNPEDITFVECQGRDRAVMLLQMLRKNIPECKNAFLFQTSTTIGVRTSLLLNGQHCLTIDEAESKTQFFDSIGLIWGMDSKNKSLIFQVPYRALLSNNIRNLLAAGRCISVTPAQGEFGGILENIRQIPACIVTGQGAGCAAAVAIEEGIWPSEISRIKLKEKLIEQNVRI